MNESPRTISQTTHENIAVDMEKTAVSQHQLLENAEQSKTRAEKIQAAYVNQVPYSEAELNQTISLEATAAITQLRYLRGHIHELGERVLQFRRAPINHATDINECRANLTLAYRHLEDARMRLGKAIQSIDGGVSVYDK